jgi:hypothetical protein
MSNNKCHNVEMHQVVSMQFVRVKYDSAIDDWCEVIDETTVSVTDETMN